MTPKFEDNIRITKIMKTFDKETLEDGRKRFSKFLKLNLPFQ